MFSGIRIPYAEVYALDKILNDRNRLLSDRGRPVTDSGVVVWPASEGLFASSFPSEGMADWGGVIAHRRKMVNDQFGHQKVCHGRTIYEPFEGSVLRTPPPKGGCPKDIL